MSRKNDHENKGRQRRRRHPFRKFLLLVIMAAFIITGYSRFIEPYLLTTSYDSLTSPYLTASSLETGDDTGIPRLRIVLFADTHFSEYYTPENFAEVVSRINSQDPDIVFFAGDLVDDLDSYEGSLEEIGSSLAGIKARIGKYAVYGNHDYGGGMQFKYPEVMAAGGFDLLVNETVDLADINVCIMGIDDIVIGYGNAECASWLDAGRCNIVVCHEPDVFDEMSGCNIDLMLSGHTHGRQIDLSIFDDYILPAYGKKYVKGRYDFENERHTTLFVTSGIGMTKLPLRLASPPEVTVTDLT